MYIGFLISALILIVFAVAMMLAYRPGKGLEKQHLGMWSLVILIGLAILLRGYDVIPSIGGWTLVGIAILLFWTLVYDVFLRKKK